MREAIPLPKLALLGCLHLSAGTCLQLTTFFWAQGRSLDEGSRPPTNGECLDVSILAVEPACNL